MSWGYAAMAALYSFVLTLALLVAYEPWLPW